MAEKENTNGIGIELDINARICELIAIKKEENEHAIGRLNTIETAWKDVNTDLDAELKTEIDLLGDEAEAMDEAKNRLLRNPCAGVDKDSLGIGGKVVDSDSHVGLPGLSVAVYVAKVNPENGPVEETRTDSYGNFSARIPVAILRKRGAQPPPLLFVVSLNPESVVHTEEIEVEPMGGKTEQVILTVRCTAPLKGALEYGKKISESVESDEAIFKLRADNMNEAYTAFSRLPDNTLPRIQELRDELSTAGPELKRVKIVSVVSDDSEAKRKTRYLANTSTHEFHDLDNEKKNCRIDQIRFDHWISFKTEKEATEAGYDFCAYCFGKDKSKW